MSFSFLKNPAVSHQEVASFGLRSTRLERFIGELLSNSSHFLFLKNLTALALDGWIGYLTDPAEYLLLVAMLLQAGYLSRPAANRFWGNLIGVSLYTLIDVPLDGLEFFTDVSHVVFWGFSVAIAILQGLRDPGQPSRQLLLIPLESLVRTWMILAFFGVVRIGTLDMRAIAQIWQTAHPPTQVFLVGSLTVVGILLGLQTLQVTRQQQQLRETASVLNDLAQWGMGPHAVQVALTHPESFQLQRCDRTIVFMDIRQFTRWCEQTSPEQVAALLNYYYTAVEPSALQYHPLRVVFSGDEVMAIYTTPQAGVAAAQAMQYAASKVLIPSGLGAGCAVHCGSVMEGLFGGKNVRTYTVIGDVVNTAKRLESSTPAGEVVVSDAVYQAMDQQLSVLSRPPMLVKGKEEPLVSWALLSH